MTDQEPPEKDMDELEPDISLPQPDIAAFRQKKERLRREIAERKAKKAAEEQHDEDLIPDASDTYELSEADVEMDQIIDNIDIVDAYNRWCGKMRPQVRKGQREGIKISCPNPAHPDKNPSAWINLDKQTWYCGGCAEGGDAHDIAAWYFGFSVPQYKDGPSFHQLRRQMAEDLGFTITRLAGGVSVVTPPAPAEEEESGRSSPESGGGESEEESGEVASNVVTLYDDDEEDEKLPGLDWTPLVPEDTFLWEYMDATTVDDVPEEYHLFHALIALGFALGRQVRLRDTKPVHGNLFVCMLGQTGAGKSKAASYLQQVLRSAMPYDDDPLNKGVKRISNPGSAEVLIYSFQKPVEDPTNPKKVAYYAPVKGLIEFGELSGLASRSDRQGSVLKPHLMEFYDASEYVETSSMSTGRKVAIEPFASTLTTTQPRALRSLLSRNDEVSGFLNRWVFVPGTRKQRFAIGGETVDLTNASTALKSIVGWSASFGPEELVDWSNEAAELYTRFFRDRIDADEMRSDTNLLSRMNLTTKKLILLFAANRRERAVSAQSVRDAIYCYDYLIDSYAVIDSQIGQSDYERLNEKILEVVKKHRKQTGKWPSPRDITKRLKTRKASYKAEMQMISRSIDTLVQLDLLTPQKAASGPGRPTTRYAINE